MRGTQLTPDAVTPGTFEDHLEGMRRGATTRPTILSPDRQRQAPRGGQSRDGSAERPGEVRVDAPPPIEGVDRVRERSRDTQGPRDTRGPRDDE
jgi:hypothetical protein